MNPLTLLSGPYGLLIKLGLVAVAIVGAAWGWSSYTSGLIEDGRKAGVTECTATYTERDNKALQAAIVAQTDAEARATRLEQDAAKAQSQASAAYQRGVNDAKRKTDALVAAARAGSLVLVDPGSSGCTASSGPAGPTPPVSTAIGDNAAPGTGLSGKASAFLLSEANRADEVVRQLQAAQARILSDIGVCNAP